MTKQQTLSAPFFTLIHHFDFQATATITVNTRQKTAVVATRGIAEQLIVSLCQLLRPLHDSAFP